MGDHHSLLWPTTSILLSRSDSNCLLNIPGEPELLDQNWNCNSTDPMEKKCFKE